MANEQNGKVDSQSLLSEQRGMIRVATDAARCGAKVTVDLVNHTLAINDGLLIDGGKWQGELGVEPTDEANALARIEQAFGIFERSVPAHDGRDHSRWFKACDEDQLTDKQLATGEDRPLARCWLELLVLAFILNGSLTRDGRQMKGKWFWQSPNYPNLVILTDWLSTHSSC